MNFQLIFQIEVDIFEPQGISELEAEGTFITNELQNIVKKTFSEKKVQWLLHSIYDYYTAEIIMSVQNAVVASNESERKDREKIQERLVCANKLWIPSWQVEEHLHAVQKPHTCSHGAVPRLVGLVLQQELETWIPIGPFPTEELSQ